MLNYSVGEYSVGEYSPVEESPESIPFLCIKIVTASTSTNTFIPCMVSFAFMYYMYCTKDNLPLSGIFPSSVAPSVDATDIRFLWNV